MRDVYGFNTQEVISLDLVNSISQELIALTETQEDLERLALNTFKEQEARKEAWKMAYKEIPMPNGIVSLETRRMMQERRNELAEEFYQQIIKKSA